MVAILLQITYGDYQDLLSKSLQQRCPGSAKLKVFKPCAGVKTSGSPKVKLGLLSLSLLEVFQFNCGL